MYYVLAYMRMGNKEQAFAWLAKAESQRTGLIGRVRFDPVYDLLREDSRYQTYQTWLKRVSFSQ